MRKVGTAAGAMAALVTCWRNTWEMLSPDGGRTLMRGVLAHQERMVCVSVGSPATALSNSA
ncbi:hypothetical protein [Streptomyces sp. AP-93]|uniref:hypothetical protein n=1 Tax=Streptomyces sp. AP-93 TaxID=2929048 RepID=UPI001FAEB102|nr:hypothetical protein [Streptomyces sp. AP-93]MCJ0872103.1 hypothetical protein [Streptomyces sp. AP-93]